MVLRTLPAWFIFLFSLSDETSFCGTVGIKPKSVRGGDN